MKAIPLSPRVFVCLPFCCLVLCLLAMYCSRSRYGVRKDYRAGVDLKEERLIYLFIHLVECPGIYQTTVVQIRPLLFFLVACAKRVVLLHVCACVCSWCVCVCMRTRAERTGSGVSCFVTRGAARTTFLNVRRWRVSSRDREMRAKKEKTVRITSSRLICPRVPEPTATHGSDKSVPVTDNYTSSRCGG